MKNIIKEKQMFERLEVRKDVLKEMFKVSMYKNKNRTPGLDSYLIMKLYTFSHNFGFNFAIDIKFV
jgi:hypothetical protein